MEEVKKEADAEMMSEGHAGLSSSDSMSSAGSFLARACSIPG